MSEAAAVKYQHISDWFGSISDVAKLPSCRSLLRSNDAGQPFCFVVVCTDNRSGSVRTHAVRGSITVEE